MDFKDRIGNDSGTNRLEDALAWASANGIHFLDFSADIGPNVLDSWTDERVAAIQATCHEHDIHIGLHTLSGVNVAEFSPFLSDAVDEYLHAYMDLAKRMGCEWTIVHAGFHFTSNRQDRVDASLARLQRATAYAESTGVRLLLENLNFEPDDAEVHYLAHTIEECKLYFDAIKSPNFGMAFTINHANLVPEGIGGFLDAFGVDRIGEVRLADNNGDKEVHLLPGEGNIDFPSVFRRIEDEGYTGHYSMAFGTLDDRIRARDEFAGYAG